MRYTLHNTLRSLNMETLCRTHHYASSVRTCLFAFGHFSLGYIACLKTSDALLLWQIAAREAQRIQPGADSFHDR